MKFEIHIHNHGSVADLRINHRQFQKLLDGLAAIAEAAANPEDNSEQIKKLTARLDASSDVLEAAVEAQQPQKGE